ncbi:MAG: NYN domain-containing protein [Phycisphaerales bacterium]
MLGVPTAVYIDGFNFYYGAARPHGIRWVDLRRMAQHILGRRNRVAQVFLYPAPLHDRGGADGRIAERHELYLRAQRVAGGVEVVLGRHVTGSRRLPILRPDGTTGDLVTVLQTVEKGTDVNLAVDLVHHALTRRFEAAVVVSNDSDLCSAVRIARTVGGIPVGIINPHIRRQSHHLATEASFLKTVRRSDLASSQLPNFLRDSLGIIERPIEW